MRQEESDGFQDASVSAAHLAAARAAIAAAFASSLVTVVAVSCEQTVRLRPGCLSTHKDRYKRNPPERTAVLAAPLSEERVPMVTRDASETQTDSQRFQPRRTQPGHV